MHDQNFLDNRVTEKYTSRLTNGQVTPLSDKWQILMYTFSKSSFRRPHSFISVSFKTSKSSYFMWYSTKCITVTCFVAMKGFE